MDSPTLSEFDLHLFAEGRHWHIYNVLGAHVCRNRGVEGVRFAVWAPHDSAVSVAGDFNEWEKVELKTAGPSKGIDTPIALLLSKSKGLILIYDLTSSIYYFLFFLSIACINAL